MSTIINATTTNGVVIQPDNSGSLVLQTNNGTTALTIDTSQNVGIGTTSPLFATGGGLSIYNATAARIKLGDSTSGIGSSDGVELIYDDDAYLFNRENTSLIFGTNNTERMRIDSSGRVTMPSQPAFHANCNGTTQLSGTKLLFQTVATNIGSSYNSSTSTFTAPIAGTYYIYGATMANTGTGRLYWRFAKNGSFFQVSQAGGDSTNYGEWFGSMTVTLAASDSIFMYLDSGTPYGGNSNEQYFGGYLLG